MTDIPTVTTTSALRETAMLPRWASVATWVAPIMIVFGFAFMAVAPLVVSVAGILRSKVPVTLRVLAVAWAVVYAVPFVMYMAQDIYPSMARMYPLWAHVIMALPGAAIAVMLVLKRR